MHSQGPTPLALIPFGCRRGPSLFVAEGSVLLHSFQLRLGRGHPLRKKRERRGKKEGGGEGGEKKNVGQASPALFFLGSSKAGNSPAGEGPGSK